jgi:hypothetical protein
MTNVLGKQLLEILRLLVNADSVTRHLVFIASLAMSQSKSSGLDLRNISGSMELR